MSTKFLVLRDLILEQLNLNLLLLDTSIVYQYEGEVSSINDSWSQSPEFFSRIDRSGYSVVEWTPVSDSSLSWTK